MATGETVLGRLESEVSLDPQKMKEWRKAKEDLLTDLGRLEKYVDTTYRQHLY